MSRCAAAPALALAFLLLPACGAKKSTESWACSATHKEKCCDFENPPTETFFWDEACLRGQADQNGRPQAPLGCNADGKNLQCRYCGQGRNGSKYQSVYCGASKCSFANAPQLSYYWEGNCKIGMIGCNADGQNKSCRFCGEYPYNMSDTLVRCPKDARAVAPKVAVCKFANPPKTPVFWDPTCRDGWKGCKADGKNLGCRFCGGKLDYKDVPCPPSTCRLPLNASHLYYWEKDCNNGKVSLGCNADGVHPQCRYCSKDGSGMFASVPCPVPPLV